MNRWLGVIMMVLGVAFGGSVWGQEVVKMSNHDTLQVELCNADGVIVYDDGGLFGMYSNSFEGSVVITAAEGAEITVEGTSVTELNYDTLWVSDGSDAEGDYVCVTGEADICLTSTTGKVVIRFRSDGSKQKSGFELRVRSASVENNCHGDLGEVSVRVEDANTVWLRWSGASSEVVARYGDEEVTASGGEVQLSGLERMSNYELYVYDAEDDGMGCCAKYMTFRTWNEPAIGCLDASDLDAPYVTTYIGTTGYPFAIEEKVDYGPSSIYSRHTVHRSVTERDARTDSMLLAVPEGEDYSVRLGNWKNGAEAEAIMYALRVDTLVADLLVLKYAAVFENPNHTPVEQPRFRIELMNTDMELIDTVCSYADFVSSLALGWNSLNDGALLWKDWTTVGIDLTPYSGQTILLRLTIYDCSQGGHYGYAYYNLKCARKSVHSASCGLADSNTFTVPSGFEYLWYSDSTTREPLGYTNSLTVEQQEDKTYYCQLSFVDNPGCNFVMSAYAGARWPLAIFDAEGVQNDCAYDIGFTNRSTITTDHVTPIGNGEQCETALWLFGDGTSSEDYNASHAYAEGGEYEVMLVSGIADGACLDTARLTVHVPEFEDTVRIEGPTERCPYAVGDTLRIVGAAESDWEDGYIVVAPTSDTTYTVAYRTENGCERIAQHTMTMLAGTIDTVVDTVWESELPYTYNDEEFEGEVSHQLFRLVNMEGCDSLIDFSLYVIKRLPTVVTMAENVCAGASIEMSLANKPLTTLGHNERIFLPDGVECGATGCSYRSYVTFGDFADGDTVISAEDINYVRINMEHSYSEDIYIGLTCPNGKRVSIMNWSENGTSPCASSVPMEHRGWKPGMNTVAYFGVAYDQENPLEVCDSTAPGNEPGIGWNYCWSSSTTAGISYAAGSYVYREASVSNVIIDSSNVAGLSNFYRPDMSFDNLVGCPLNGDWYIEVIDAFSQDNGYIFGWDISLNADRVRSNKLCNIASMEVEGPWLRKSNDSTYYVDVPATIERDTVVSYQYTVVDSCGNRGDTTLTLTVHPTKRSEVVDTVKESQLPYRVADVDLMTDADKMPIVLTSTSGCDSVVEVSLTVLWNSYRSMDTTVCDNRFPLHWNGHTFYGSGSLRDTLENAAGGDSIVTSTVMTWESYSDTVRMQSCEGSVVEIGGVEYAEEGTYTERLQSMDGCDSVVTLELTIIPVPWVEVEASPVCRSEEYVLTARTDAMYVRWVAVPEDTMLVGHETERTVHVKPLATTIYTAYVDNSSTDMCEQSDSIHLHRLKGLEAHLKSIPSLLHIDDLDYTAYDVTIGRVVERKWWVDGEEQREQGKSIVRRADAEADSVVLALAVDNGLCRDTARLTVPIYNVGVTAPNAFTPLEDDNNRFVLGMLGVMESEMHIYDRNGRLVYTSTDIAEGWDGRDTTGTMCQQGDYVWVLEYTTEDYPTRKQKKVGTVLLIK